MFISTYYELSLNRQKLQAIYSLKKNNLKRKIANKRVVSYTF